MPASSPTMIDTISELETPQSGATMVDTISEITTSQSSPTMEDTIGTQIPWSLIRSDQIGYRTLTPDRLVNVPIDVLGQINHWDLTQTTIKTIYTTPNNKLGFALGLFIQVTAVTNLTVVPQISLGIASGEDDILAIEPLTGISAVNDVWSNWVILSKARNSVPTELIKLNITGATADKLLAHIYLLGFEV